MLLTVPYYDFLDGGPEIEKMSEMITYINVGNSVHYDSTLSSQLPNRNVQ